MVNYNNGKIYKIEAINGEEGDIYIGSTTKELLCQRMTKHREGYKQWQRNSYNKTTSFLLFEKYGVENCKIVLIENVKANSKDELLSRESFYIKSMSCVNKCIPMRTEKEWRKDNKETLKKNRKLYHENNKDNIEEYMKLYRDNNKDKIKETIKLYRNKNKEKTKEYNKLYREKNKEIDRLHMLNI
jgi:adenylate kinase family enzyme